MDGANVQVSVEDGRLTSGDGETPDAGEALADGVGGIRGVYDSGDGDKLPGSGETGEVAGCEGCDEGCAVDEGELAPEA